MTSLNEGTSNSLLVSGQRRETRWWGLSLNEGTSNSLLVRVRLRGLCPWRQHPSTKGPAIPCWSEYDYEGSAPGGNIPQRRDQQFLAGQLELECLVQVGVVPSTKGPAIPCWSEYDYEQSAPGGNIPQRRDQQFLAGQPNETSVRSSIPCTLNEGTSNSLLVSRMRLRYAPVSRAPSTKGPAIPCWSE